MRNIKPNKAYMREVVGNSSACPGCDDPDVTKELDPSQSDPGFEDYDCFCETCNLGWKETYKLQFLGYIEGSFVDEGGENLETKIGIIADTPASTSS